MKADLILYNGKVYTHTQTAAPVTAVAIRDGRFVATGSDAEVYGPGRYEHASV